MHGAARAAARSASGSPWSDAADNPATVDALARAFDELSGIDEDQRGRLRAQGPAVGMLVTLVEDMAARLQPWHRPVDLAAAAVEQVRSQPERWRTWLGTVVLYLPEQVDTAEGLLVGALAEVTALTAIVGTTGQPEVDARIGELAGALGGSGRFDVLPYPGGRAGFDEAAAPGGAAAPGESAGSGGLPSSREAAAPGALAGVVPCPVVATATRSVDRVAAPSVDAEVLAALRWLSGHWHRGTSLQAMALVHPAAAPYPRLAHDLVAAAGLPFFAASHRPLATTVTGRVLTGALALPDHHWRRDDTLAWMACGPLVDPTTGSPLPVADWDRCSRTAGVVGGLDQWSARLGAEARRLRRRAVGTAAAASADDHATADPVLRHGEPDALLDAACQAEELAAFVAAMGRRFEATPTTWSGWSEWCRQLLLDVLGGAARRDQWDSGEDRQAFDDVMSVVESMAEVGMVEPMAEIGGVRRAFDAALRAPAPTTARSGHGLLVGTPDSVVGTGRTVVAVVGMADGWMPAPESDDTLLSPSARRAAGMAPSPHHRRSVHERRAFAAVVAEACRLLLCTSRADPRSGRLQWPSPWWGSAPSGACRDIESFPDLVDGSSAPEDEPVDGRDHRMRSLVRWRKAVGTLGGHPALDAAAISVRVDAARMRRSRQFSRFEGRVGPVAELSPFDGPPRSPTSLERYAVCPRRHFFTDVLGAVGIPRPEALDRITPVDQGSLIHRVLERFMAEQVVLPPAQRRQPGQRWDEDDRRRLLAIFDDVAAGYEATGRTGWPVLWALDRAAIARELVDFLEHDSDWRAGAGAVPEAVELRFGDDEPLVVSGGNGRQVRFHGVVDRVDRTASGAVVVDYKTGSAAAFRGMGPGDPVAGGTRLQLPVYALAARQRLGHVPVSAYYWFVTADNGFSRSGYEVDDTVVERFTAAVATLTAGIDAGAFPARPGAESNGTFEACRYCEFDTACSTGRADTWASVRLDPALAELVALVEPAAGGDQ